MRRALALGWRFCWLQLPWVTRRCMLGGSRFPLAAFVASCCTSAQRWRGAAWRGWMFGWAHLTLANNLDRDRLYASSKDAGDSGLGRGAAVVSCTSRSIPALAALLARTGSREGGVDWPIWRSAWLAAWIVFEWVSSWAFTGYPWPPLGLDAAWSDWDGLPDDAPCLPFHGLGLMRYPEPLTVGCYAGGLAWINASQATLGGR